MFYSFSNDTCANFEKVTIVKIEKREKNNQSVNRLILNFDYTISKDKDYVDYLYVDDYKPCDINFLSKKWFTDDFIKISNVYINKRKIANIKYRNGKIIVNVGVAKSHEFVCGEDVNKGSTSLYFYEIASKDDYINFLKKLKNRSL